MMSKWQPTQLHITASHSYDIYSFSTSPSVSWMAFLIECWCLDLQTSINMALPIYQLRHTPLATCATKLSIYWRFFAYFMHFNWRYVQKLPDSNSINPPAIYMRKILMPFFANTEYVRETKTKKLGTRTNEDHTGNAGRSYSCTQ